MGARESLSKHPRVTIGITLAVCLLAVGYLVMSMFGASLQAEPRKVWFTDDDGKTWFADDAARKPPFDHNGKPAVMCFVYTCDGGKTKWVSHMLRYTASSKKKIQEAAVRLKIPEEKIEPGAMAMEVKEAGTGEGGWVSTQDPRAAQIMELRCPDGSKGDIIEVDPN
jgi:hypothetical protein